MLLVLWFLRSALSDRPMIPCSDSLVESFILRDGLLVLIEKLTARPINMDMPASAGMLVSLHAPVLSAPSEVLRVVPMELAVERGVMALMLCQRVDTFCFSRASQMNAF